MARRRALTRAQSAGDRRRNPRAFEGCQPVAEQVWRILSKERRQPGDALSLELGQ